MTVRQTTSQRQPQQRAAEGDAKSALYDRPGGISREEKKAIFAKLDEAMCKQILETVMDEGPGI